MNVERFLDEGADYGCVVEGVDEFGREGGKARELIDAGEGVVEEGARGMLVMVGEELGFVGGHVDGDGALGFAGFAGEAEVEGFADLLVGPSIGEDFVLHELPEEMGAATGGVELFAGRHEAGAHGGGVGFAAGSYSNAAESGRGEGAVFFGEGEVSFGLPGFVVGAEAKVFVDLVGVDELVGVHAIGGIEDAFEPAKGLHQVFAEHFREESAASLAVAVFAGEGAAVGESNVGGAVHELAEFEDSFFGLEVKVEAHVDAALTEMPVHGARVVVFGHEGADGAEVAAELRGVYGCIFPALPSGTYSGDEGCRAEARFTDVPDAFRLVVGVDPRGGLCGEGLHGGNEGPSPGVGFCLCGGAEFDDEEAVASGQKLEVGEEFLFATERVEEITINAFEADRLVFEDLGDVVGCEKDVGKAYAYKGSAGWGFYKL